MKETAAHNQGRESGRVTPSPQRVSECTRGGNQAHSSTGRGPDGSRTRSYFRKGRRSYVPWEGLSSGQGMG